MEFIDFSVVKEFIKFSGISNDNLEEKDFSNKSFYKKIYTDLES